MKKNKFGFTLFELLVSISIIAILTAVATVSYSSMQKKARDSRRIEDMENIRKAEEQIFMLNNSNYVNGAAIGNCSSGGSWSVNGQIILASVPLDPKGVGWTAYTFQNCGGNPLGQYCICAALENSAGNSANNACTSWVNGTGAYYCVNNQQ